MEYGRYQDLEKVGEGTYGVVYKALDPHLGMSVALKVLKRQWTEDESVVDTFIGEGQTLARLDHPNIVRVYDVGREAGTVYIAMQFIEGGTLGDAMKGKRFSPEEIVHLGIAMAKALHYLHQEGIVHRDIKPGNIMGSDDKAKITDFGIARVGDVSRTLAGVRRGSPPYMSPEQTLGRPVDRRSDIWSLGVVLYEMSTGKRPFVVEKRDAIFKDTDEQLAAIFKKIREENPPSPLKTEPSISEDLSQVIMKCLYKNPQDRYGTGEALAKALEACLHERVPPHPTHLALLILIGTILFGGGLIGILFHVWSPKPVVKPGVLKFEAPSGAHVFVNGVPKGDIPLRLELPAGKYQLNVKLADYEDWWDSQAEVKEGIETLVPVPLLPSVGDSP